jgi:putative ABC transport system ATP-binding protein
MGGHEVRALVDIDFIIEPGSFWAIMGPSGSGKSTMMNLIGCLDHLTHGKYFLSGREVSGLDDNALSAVRLTKIGFIFQSFNLIPQFTVQKNIELPLYYLGYDHGRSDERARELAEMLGLSDRLRHRPAELSGGQRQRVAIARALANDPELILADEPTGNLDTATGQQVLKILNQLNQSQKTIVMVTHEADVAAHARRRLYMRDGRIERME